MTVSQEAEIKRNQIPEQYRAHGADSGALAHDFAFADERHNLDFQRARSAPPITGDGAFSHSEYELHSQALATTLGEGESAGVMLSGAQQQKRIADEARSGRKRREREQRHLAMLDAIDAHIARLDARIAEIDLELDRINARRMEIGDQLEALDELERLNASGKLDVRNAEHQRLMKKAGIPSDTPAADIDILIENERQSLSGEDGALEQESNDLIRERDELKAEREEALAVRDALDNADTPEALEIAQERAQSILSTSQLTDLALQSDQSATRNAAAKIVAKTDGNALGDDLAQSSVTETKSDVLKADMDNFNFDAPAP